MSKFKLPLIRGGKKITKNKIVILTLSLLGLYQPAQAITLIGWDIPTSATVPAPTGSTVLAGMSVATGVTAGNFTMGTGLVSSSTSSAWRVSGYGTTTTDAAALAAANTAGDYWAFQFGASSGYSVTVNGIGSGSWSTSASGPAKMSMIYSTSSDFASYSTIATATATAGTTFNFVSSFTTALANAPITIAEGVTGFFRLVGYGSSGTTPTNGTGGLVGNLTAPDFSILGTSTSLALLNWTGGTGEWANGVAANWQNTAGASTAWAAGKDGTIANGGTLAVDAGGVTAGVVTVSGATAATFTGGAVSAGSLAMTAGSTLNLNNANSAVSGAIDLTDATLSGGSLAVGSAAVTVSTGTKTISTSLSGATATLTKSGAGELILSGDNTYGGQTAVAAGTLTTSKANMLSDTATLKLDNLATLKLGGDETVGAINAASGSTNNLQGFTLTAGGNNLSFTNGALTTGSGRLIKNGTGEMYLNQKSNNFTGGFTLNNGEVKFSSSGDQAAGILTNSVFGLGTLALNGGTIGSSATDSGRNIYNSVTLNNTVQVGNSAAFAALTTNANNGTAFLIFSTNTSGRTTLLGNTTLNTVGQTLWEQNISGSEYRLTKDGAGALALSNNYLQLRGSNNIAGVTVNSGILGYKNRNALGTGTLILADGVVVGQDGVINNAGLTGNAQTDRSIANNIQLNGNVTFGLGATANYLGGAMDLNGATRTITLGNTTYQYGAVTNGGLVIDNGIAIGNRTFAMFASNNYSGGTIVRTNAILEVGNDNALGTSDLTFTNTTGSGSSKFTASTMLTSASQLRTVTNNINLAEGMNVTVDAVTSAQGPTGTAVTVSLNTTLLGSITGSGGLTKSSANTLTLSGNNSYTGGTTVSAGTLIGTTASLQGAIINNSAVVFDQSGSGSYGGSMSGTGTLTKANSGTLILSGNNRYSGLTTVTAGTLTLSGDNSAASGGVTLTAGTLNLNNANALGTGLLELGAVTGSSVGSSIINNTSGGALTYLGLSGVRWSGTAPAAIQFGTSGSTSDNNMDFGSGLVTTTTARNMNIAGTGVTISMGTLTTTGTGASYDYTIDGAGNTLDLDGWKISGAATPTQAAIHKFKGSANVNIGAIENGTGSFANGVSFNSDGVTRLTGDNTYTGTTEFVGSGTNIISGNNSSAVGNVTIAGVSNSGKLPVVRLDNINAISSSSSLLGATGNAQIGTLELKAAGDFSLNSFGTASSAGNNMIFLNSSGSQKTLTFTAANNYITTASTGGRTLYNNSENLLLDFDGNIEIGGGSSSGEATTFAGVGNFNVDGNLLDTGTGLTRILRKQGDGTLTLRGSANSIRGSTLVETGTLDLYGNLTASTDIVVSTSGTSTTGARTVNSTLNVRSGASLLNSSSTTVWSRGNLIVNGTAGTVVVKNSGLLGGSGTVGHVTLESGSFLTPGNSPGTLTALSATWGAGSTYTWEINSNASSAAAGTNWDLFSVTGTLDMSALKLSTQMNLVLNSLSGFDLTSSTNRTWVIAQAGSLLGTGGAALSAGDNVSDYFNIDATAFTSVTPSLVNEWRVKVGDTGKTLNLMAIPEPSTGSMLALGFAGLVVTRILRRKIS